MTGPRTTGTRCDEGAICERAGEGAVPGVPARARAAPGRRQTEPLRGANAPRLWRAVEVAIRGPARPGCGRCVDEYPLVVPRAAVVDPERRVRTPARDTGNAAAQPLRQRTLARRGGRRGRCSEPGRPARRDGLGRPVRVVGRAGPGGVPEQLGRLGLIHDAELSVCHHRIAVAAAQETLLDERVDIGRMRARVDALVQLDGAGVLLAPEDELELAFAPGGLAPDRQRHRHRDAHDGQAYEERGQGIAPVRRDGDGEPTTRCMTCHRARFPRSRCGRRICPGRTDSRRRTRRPRSATNRTRS